MPIRQFGGSRPFRVCLNCKALYLVLSVLPHGEVVGDAFACFSAASCKLGSAVFLAITVAMGMPGNHSNLKVVQSEILVIVRE